MIFRRYRLYTLFAFVLLVILYRSLQSSWSQSAASYARPPAPGIQKPAVDTSRGETAPGPAHGKPVRPPAEYTAGEEGEPTTDEEPDTLAKSPVDTDNAKGKGKGKPEGERWSGEPGNKNSKTTLEEEESLRPVEKTPADPEIDWKTPPKGASLPNDDDGKEHWKKPEEHFPLPEESIIPLPTGRPVKIPKIQYHFATESKSDKTARLGRQKKVKAELVRAWGGYKKYAWGHDELRPLSRKTKDPFNGWGATLVDSLDTLWIADMRDDFDEAVKFVAEIDFTTSPRVDIPVFETTIRYLGGLLAAYDVSGQQSKYKVLLTKATELAEILMGIFDTPNRMPILYYHWRPRYTISPHRAWGLAGVAELGTLSMEFTRLAQLTKENKYYDAVARITDALIEMQEAGQCAISGLFPEKIDISGCNHDATTERDSLSAEAQAQLSSKETKREPQGFVPEHGTSNHIPMDQPEGGKPAKGGKKLERRAPRPPPAVPTPHPDNGHSVRAPPLKADGSTSSWDCVPQGLVARSDYSTFSMGGSQDSAYEYFPKEWLLLGGLEPKYKKLYVDAIEATNDWLLYRPMIKDESWDIIFPAKVSMKNDPPGMQTKEYEISHLTCFIGGMYALGGKIFDRPEDVKKAKQLTDGCVWAYQSTTTGLMPDQANLYPCPSLDKCKWNETTWWASLDPVKESRDKEMALWEEGEAQRKMFVKAGEHETGLSSDKGTGSKAGSKAGSKSTKVANLENDEFALGKRDGLMMPKLDKPPPSKTMDETEEEVTEPTPAKKAAGKAPKPKATPEQVVVDEPAPAPALKPQSHEEYVKERLEYEKLPPGYTAANGRSYILRPEAIESVWYMYRITGDTTWMDKGWTMFEATIAATRTEFANSAIEDVFEGSSELKDEMESFWIAETLKYYYLLFSEPGLISLDEWVLNTEAHPFKRPKTQPVF